MKKETIIIGVIVAAIVIGAAGWYLYQHETGLLFDIVGDYTYTNSGSTEHSYMEFDEYGFNRIWTDQDDTIPALYSYALLADSNENGKPEMRITSSMSDTWTRWDYDIDEYRTVIITAISSSSNSPDYDPGTSFVMTYIGPVGYIVENIIGGGI